jgi:hypothetical protein
MHEAEADMKPKRNPGSTPDSTLLRAGYGRIAKDEPVAWMKRTRNPGRSMVLI